jgi:hypothetical protein
MSAIQSPSNPSSHNSSLHSDLTDKVDSDAFEIEQESAKLQAEVQKLSKELEDLMSSRHISEEVQQDSDLIAAEEEDQAEEGLRYEDRETSRFPAATREEARSIQHSFPLSLPGKRPAKPPTPTDPRPIDFSPTLKSDSFGIMVPRPPPPTASKRPPLIDDYSFKTGWKQVNELLISQGFQALPLREDNGEVADLDTLCETMKDILADFGRCVDDLEKAEKVIKGKNADSIGLKDEINMLKSRIEEEKSIRQKEFDRWKKDLEKQNSALAAKLDSAQSQLSQREEIIRQLRDQLRELSEDDTGPVEGSDRDRAIFRQYFKRDPKGGRDGKVLTMIGAYEERRKRNSSPEPGKAEARANAVLIRELKSQIDARTREMESLEKQYSAVIEENEQLKSYSGPRENQSETLLQALDILQLKSEKQLPVALRKMQQVIRALPGLETFIKAISAEVQMGETASVENILPTIKTWKQKAIQWETWSSQRAQLCHYLHLDPFCDFPDIVIAKQLRAVKGGKSGGDVEHFKTLFEVGAEENVGQVMDQVFLFVHEMKGLLQVRSR